MKYGKHEDYDLVSGEAHCWPLFTSCKHWRYLDTGYKIWYVAQKKRGRGEYFGVWNSYMC